MNRVLDLCYLAWTHFIQGDIDAALQRCADSIAAARKLSQPYDLVVAYGNACYFYQFRRDSQAVTAAADMVIALAEEKGFPSWLSLAKIFRGWALVQDGDAENGLPLVERSLAEHRATGELRRCPVHQPSMMSGARRLQGPGADLHRRSSGDEQGHRRSLVRTGTASPSRRVPAGCQHRPGNRSAGKLAVRP
jgi:hypothetical protein